MPYLFLALAIMGEVVATTSLKASEGFTRIGPSIVVVLGYALSFYLLSICLRYFPVGTVYAIWAGSGVVLVALAGWWLFGQKIDLWGMIGMGLIIGGVMILNLVSKTSVH